MNGRALKFGALAVAAIAVVFSVVLASRFGRDPALVESPLLGQPAPVLQLELLDGSANFDMADLKGTIVVINFFASWCLECRKEHADLVATSEAFADQNVRFVQIAYQEDPSTTLAYLEDAGVSDATTYLQDDRSRAAIAYGVFGIPETFFIDEAGTVVGKIVGEADALILGATLDSIIAGETPGQQTTGDTQQRPDA
jgi:cytochrome c biogenesis protein CcmG/thiol:disulfide interchange protein DsbE